MSNNKEITNHESKISTVEDSEMLLIKIERITNKINTIPKWKPMAGIIDL